MATARIISTLFWGVATVALLLLVTTTAFAITEYPQEEYGYVPSSAEYDSAFFYTIRGNSDAAARRQQPLVLWLQGGPGGSSLFSDFLETGPMMVVTTKAFPGYELRPRPNAWTQHATILYVDNPVGTGFSYTRDPRGFATTDEQIAAALVDFLGKFLTKHPEYLSNDFWIFCESYGGKMTAYFGAALAEGIAQGSFPHSGLKFKGVEIGDGWVGPIDCMYSYAPYLRSFAQISPNEAQQLTSFAKYAQSALEQFNGTQATKLWSEQQSYVASYTSNINWYNSLFYYDYIPEDEMNAYVSQNLTAQLRQAGILPNDVTFGSQSGMVFEKLQDTFMRNAVAQVDYLLKRGYAVHVVSGQLDLIVNTLCADAWLSRLEWPGLAELYKQPRNPIHMDAAKNIGGFVQSYNNLYVWTINKAGHMVPTDNPIAAEKMFASIVGSKSMQQRGFQLSVDFPRATRNNRRKRLYKL